MAAAVFAGSILRSRYRGKHRKLLFGRPGQTAFARAIYTAKAGATTVSPGPVGELRSANSSRKLTNE